VRGNHARPGFPVSLTTATSDDLASPAFLLEVPDLLLDILDLRVDLPNFLRDLLRALAVAVLPGFGQCGLQVSQLLLEPGQLLTKLSELPAVPVVRLLAGVADP
jgi:hypothetical protein